MNGIVLIALGHPMYAHMAYNLAISIRYHGDIPITILHGGGSLNILKDWQRNIWDEVEIDMELLKRKGKVEFLKAKTLLYKYSPYEKTIFIDADTILSPFKRIQDLFNLKGLVFANRGEITETGKCQWAEIKDLFYHYKIDHWYDLSSEFIFFERSDLNKKVFEDANYYYDDETIPIVTFKEKNKEGKKGITEFNGGMPDEIPFGIAIEKNNVRFESPFLPSYWQPQYKDVSKPSEYIKRNFYIISAGGAHIQSNIKQIYKDLVKGYFSKLRINHVPYQLQAKSKLIKERKII